MTDVPIDGELADAIGTRYEFPCNVTELASLPFMTHTNIHIGDLMKMDVPQVWRAAVKRPDICIEVEDLSDAKTKTIREEAISCWKVAHEQAISRSKWLNQIGVHPDLQFRLIEPFQARGVVITTLHDDYLARMFATGSAELCLAALLLHEDDPPFNEDDLIAQSYESFLWGGDQLLNEWQTQRYDEARQGRFEVIQGTIDKQ